MVDKLFKKYINLRGWKTNRKFIVFEVDDFGLSNTLDFSSLKSFKYFHDLPFFVKHDRLVKRKELDDLFDILIGAQDSKGNSAVFSPLVITGNADFEKIKASNFKTYHSKPFTDTLQETCDSRVFEKWREGINSGVFAPEYHGRDHIHVQSWLNALQLENSKTRVAFDSGIVTLLDQGNQLNRKFGAAYSPVNKNEFHSLKLSLSSGIKYYKQAFGQTPTLFTPPAGGYSYEFNELLNREGIKAVTLGQSSLITTSSGSTDKKLHYLGQKLSNDVIAMPRNCLFEPHNRKNDAVDRCLSDIETAFKAKKPAIISSHRINFVNNDVPTNGQGLKKLDKLLKCISLRWPDAEFTTTADLVHLTRR